MESFNFFVTRRRNESMSLDNLDYVIIIFFILQCRNWMTLPVSVPKMKTKRLQREALPINHLSIGWRGREAMASVSPKLELSWSLMCLSPLRGGLGVGGSKQFWEKYLSKRRGRKHWKS